MFPWTNLLISTRVRPEDGKQGPVPSKPPLCWTELDVIPPKWIWESPASKQQYIYICIHKYIYTYTYIYIHILCTYIIIYMCAFMIIYVHICICVYVYEKRNMRKCICVPGFPWSNGTVGLRPSLVRAARQGWVPSSFQPHRANSGQQE
jgi:hypothetical protein